MENIDINYLGELAAKFWLKTGLSPTHVLLTPEQQQKLSADLKPLERNPVETSPGFDHGLVTIYLNPTTVVDVLTVSPFKSGYTHGLNYPKMLYIGEDKL